MKSESSERKENRAQEQERLTQTLHGQQGSREPQGLCGDPHLVCQEAWGLQEAII